MLRIIDWLNDVVRLGGRKQGARPGLLASAKRREPLPSELRQGFGRTPKPPNVRKPDPTPAPPAKR